MTEFCSNCGHPLSEGAPCANCGTDAGGKGSMTGRGLLPAGGWNPPRNQGPIGSIGVSHPGSEASQPGSEASHSESRSDGQQPESGIDGAGSPDRNSYHSYPSGGADDAGERGAGGELTASSGPPYEPQDSGAGSYDPDRPRWGAPAGIMVWVASVLAIIFIPAIAIGFLIVVRQVGGQRLTDRQYLEKFLQSPEVAMLAVGSTIVAHLITLAIVWAVASGLNRRSALKALGFRWMGPSPAMKFWFVIGVVILMYFAEIILGYLFPQSRETDFERLLKAGPGVRIVVAFLAVFTAPLVEECVYRGMLFSGLRRGLREWPSILIVT